MTCQVAPVAALRAAASSRGQSPPSGRVGFSDQLRRREADQADLVVELLRQQVLAGAFRPR